MVNDIIVQHLAKMNYDILRTARDKVLYRSKILKIVTITVGVIGFISINLFWCRSILINIMNFLYTKQIYYP